MTDSEKTQGRIKIYRKDFINVFFVGEGIGKTKEHEGGPSKGNCGVHEGSDGGKQVDVGVDEENTSKEAPQSHGNDKIEEILGCRNMESSVGT